MRLCAMFQICVSLHVDTQSSITEDPHSLAPVDVIEPKEQHISSQNTLSFDIAKKIAV